MAMRLMELRGLPVIDPRSAKRVGTVADAHLDPAAGRIAALDVEAADGAGILRIPVEQVRRVGQSAVMLRGPVQSLAEPPEGTWLDMGAVVGLEVLGDGGDRVGSLSDLCLNQETLRVEWFELSVPKLERWLGSGGRISPDAVLSCSRELMLVRGGKQTAEAEDETAALGAPATSAVAGSAGH